MKTPTHHHTSSLKTLMRTFHHHHYTLGLFDPPSLNPYSNIKKDKVVQSPYHRDLAIQVAVRSVVMLKHIKRTLPVNTFGRLSVCHIYVLIIKSIKL